MKKNKILILIGPPGSGKSTYAKQFTLNDKTYKIISRDGLRYMFNGDYRVEEATENLINKVFKDLVKTTLKTHNVILDSCYCKMKYIKQVIDDFGELAQIDYKFMEDLTIGELVDRNENREVIKKVPYDVITRFKQGYDYVRSNFNEIDFLIMNGSGIKSEEVETPKYDSSKEDCIIIDLDGTLAHRGDRRGPFDWNKVDLDEPDWIVWDIIERYCGESGWIATPVFVSGREGTTICRQKTLNWLEIHFGLINPILYMRKEKDYRKDSIIKREIYESYIGPYYNVNFILDDRNSVCDMWRNELGLKCLQVAEGDF